MGLLKGGNFLTWYPDVPDYIDAAFALAREVLGPTTTSSPPRTWSTRKSTSASSTSSRRPSSAVCRSTRSAFRCAHPSPFTLHRLSRGAGSQPTSLVRALPLLHARIPPTVPHRQHPRRGGLGRRGSLWALHGRRRGAVRQDREPRRGGPRDGDRRWLQPAHAAVPDAVPPPLLRPGRAAARAGRRLCAGPRALPQHDCVHGLPDVGQHRPVLVAQWGLGRGGQPLLVV